MENEIQVKTFLYPILHGISGALAADISTIILYPFDCLAIRMQIGSQEHMMTDAGPMDGPTYDFSKMRRLARQVYKKEGIRGFYKGLLPMLFGNHFSYGTFFMW